MKNLKYIQRNKHLIPQYTHGQRSTSYLDLHTANTSTLPAHLPHGTPRPGLEQHLAAEVPHTFVGKTYDGAPGLDGGPGGQRRGAPHD